MNDPDIRQLLFSHIKNLKLSGSKPVILEEVPIRNGYVRADVVIASDNLECFEIKSEYDSLKRLMTQGWHYNQSFNRVTLVSATKHLTSALNIVPDWWGIIEVTRNGELVEFRKTTKNPYINTLGLAELLNKKECISLLNLKKQKGLSNLSNKVLHQHVSESYKINDLKKSVLQLLKKRTAVVTSLNTKTFAISRILTPVQYDGSWLLPYVASNCREMSC